MYESFYGFHRRPFASVPDLSSYFVSRNEEQIRTTVSRVLRRAEGPAIILGGTGFGKTSTALQLAHNIARDLQVVFLQGAQLCSRRALLQSILAKLNLPYRDLGEGELRLNLYEYLQPNPKTPWQPLALIVDEADTLPIKLLEELRAISNIVVNGDARARIVLVGSMRLEHTLANPQLEALNQRLAVRCYLTSWNAEEVAQEIRFQIQVAGGKPESICTSEATHAAYRATEGIPRLVHQLLDHALLLGYNYGQKPISASLIEEAWADLQQLPSPWSERNEPISTAPTSTIEFGSLDDGTVFELEEDFSASTTPKTPSSRNDQPIVNKNTSPSSVLQNAPLNTSPKAIRVPTTPITGRNIFGDDFTEEITITTLAPTTTKPTIELASTFDNTPNNADLFANWLELADAFQDEPRNVNPVTVTNSIFPASEIEEELQDAIGSLNYSAMTAEFNLPSIHRLHEIAEHSHFDELYNDTAGINSIGDDRDILIIEDDISTSRKATENGAHSRVGRPHTRLFSQLKQ